MKKNNIYQLVNRNDLLIVILIAFIIRIVVFVSLQPWNSEQVNKTILVSDASEYHQLAFSLLSKKSLEDFDAFRTPGYPVFVALIYGIFSNNIWFILLVQIVLNVISVFLVYKIALTVFSRKIALLSAFIFAIDIEQALIAVKLLTDTLFVFLFLSAIYYLCKSIKENNLSSICISAILLGTATLVRPISFLFPFIAVFSVLVLCNLKIKMKLVYSLVFSFVFIVTISPWLLHNYSKYGEPKLSAISGYNLLFFNIAYTEVHKTGKTIDQVRTDLIDMAIKQGADTTGPITFKNSQIYSNIAKHYIKDNFILYCKGHFMGILNMYANLDTQSITTIFHRKYNPSNIVIYGEPNIFITIIDFFKSRSIIEIFIAFVIGTYLLINYLLTFTAIILLIRKNEKFVFLFILIILYFSALTGTVGIARYRIPFMPFINTLCAVGLLHFYDKMVDKFSSVKN
jgi:4-amino-4-deoxy-L-arabinose transferase-like glycosyltransferase